MLGGISASDVSLALVATVVKLLSAVVFSCFVVLASWYCWGSDGFDRIDDGRLLVAAPNLAVTGWFHDHPALQVEALTPTSKPLSPKPYSFCPRSLDLLLKEAAKVRINYAAYLSEGWKSACEFTLLAARPSVCRADPVKLSPSRTRFF